MTILKTPRYGIEYSGPGEKPKDYTTQQERLAKSVEAALALASIPDTGNPDVRVAPTAAARDAYFGTPSTAAAQLALQNRGALAIRTDTGQLERYYGLYNVNTNKGGRAVAGWYPMGPMTAQYTVSFSSGGTAPDSIGLPVLRAAVSTARAADLFTPVAGGLSLRNPGLYRFGFDFTAGTAKLGTRSFVDMTVRGEAIRFGLADGAGVEDRGADSSPDFMVTAPTSAAFAFYRNTGAQAQITGRIFATYLGPNN